VTHVYGGSNILVISQIFSRIVKSRELVRFAITDKKQASVIALWKF